MTSRRRLGLALLWLALLVLAGAWISSRLHLSGDLRRFMPAPRTQAQRLLLDELGKGPASRLVLIALSGDRPDALAAISQSMHEQLAKDARFTLVANGGDMSLQAIPERLRPYRYLLSDTLDTQSFDADYLRAHFEARIQDLGSPAASMVEPLLASDPTLETLRLAERWRPAKEPQRIDGVWFDRAGKEALLAVQTVAPGFDPTGQVQAINEIRDAFEHARAGSQARLEMTGPGAFSVEIGARTSREAGWIGTVDSIALLLLLWFAYRSWKTPLLGALPLASAGLAGLGATAALFESVHGITVAFGFTLIGVVQDYPIHLFSHQRPGVSPQASARQLWPTLATGVASTCIAYVTFLVSGVDGLQQLAVFTIAGLGTAALATRFLLPALLDPMQADVAGQAWLARTWTWVERLPRPRLAFVPLALAAIAVIAFAPGQFWQNDLSKLTPVPADGLQRDARLRHELGAPDVRYLVALDAKDGETALRASERLLLVLDRLVARGAIDGFDSPARYLPSAVTQKKRQARLPDRAGLQMALDAALASTEFRSDAFNDFVDDVELARTAPPLRPSDLTGTPLATRLSGLLLVSADHATALVSLNGLHDPAIVASAVAAQDAQLLDLKQASESLVQAYRERVLTALAIAALLLALTVWLALRQPRRVLRVLAPMALSTLLILAVLRGAGVELNLFHLVSLVLAAGLGLDYALFFDHAGDDYKDQLRTLHAVIVCSITTLLVFSLLALSSIPVLRAIGSAVALGVVSNFVLSLLIVRGAGTSHRSLDA